MRKLATIRRIEAIEAIPNADAIVCASVGGWRVVVKKDEFQIGQLAVYFEIDTWIPEAIAPFLCREHREFNGVIGARLRTVKLRGQISQGLLIPCPEGEYSEGDDVSEALGVQKYEAPIAPHLSGMVRGSFPSRIPKTDQERVQNLASELREWVAQRLTWELSEKLDGTSMTAYLLDGVFGVCSRNLDLVESDENTYWRVARALDLETQLRAIGRDIAIAGELIGEGIQKNRYQLKGQDFYLFDVYDVQRGEHLSPTERHAMALHVNHVPVLSSATIESSEIPALLLAAEGKSKLNPNAEREGIVFKCHEQPLSFKAISNKFLLKHE